MIPSEALEALARVPGARIRTAEPVARHGHLRLGGPVELYAAVHDLDALEAVLAALRAHRVRWRVLHALADVVAGEDGLGGALVRLGSGFAGVEADADGIVAGAVAPLARIGAVARAAGLQGLAALEGWPGTVGSVAEEGGLAAFGEALRGTRVLHGRGVRERGAEEGTDLPPSAVLLGVRLAGSLPRRATPPPPPGALASDLAPLQPLLRRSGLLGLRLRSVRLAPEAPGVVVNLGGATRRDLDLVIKLVNDRLQRDHGVELQCRLGSVGRPAPRRRT